MSHPMIWVNVGKRKTYVYLISYTSYIICKYTANDTTHDRYFTLPEKLFRLKYIYQHQL